MLTDESVEAYCVSCGKRVKGTLRSTSVDCGLYIFESVKGRKSFVEKVALGRAATYLRFECCKDHE